jgi:hypothetical protein
VRYRVGLRYVRYYGYDARKVINQIHKGGEEKSEQEMRKAATIFRVTQTELGNEGNEK